MFYYFGFSYLKPKKYWPLRIIFIAYILIVYSGLIYDLTTDKIKYYSSNSQYLEILLRDEFFYYIYVFPIIGIFITSYLWEFFLTVDNKNKPNR